MSENTNPAAKHYVDEQVTARKAALLADTGDRSAPRVPCDLAVVVSGSNGGFVARSCDVSRSGVLLQLRYGDHILDGPNPASFGEILLDICSYGADVAFSALGFSVRAEVIRAADGTRRQGGAQVLALRFLSKLTPEQCLALKVDEEGSD